MHLRHLILAIFELGLPVTALSWLLFYRLYGRGDLARDADHKTIRAGLKQIRKATKQSGAHADNVLHKKWMKFGGGFYGIAALWTLIVMEVSGVVNTVLHPSGLEALLSKGIIGIAVQLLVNQMLTFVAALTWFTYWSEKDDSLFTWLLVAYMGYLLGLNIARLELAPATRLMSVDWRGRLRAAFRIREKREQD